MPSSHVPPSPVSPFPFPRPRPPVPVTPSPQETASPQPSPYFPVTSLARHVREGPRLASPRPAPPRPTRPAQPSPADIQPAQPAARAGPPPALPARQPVTGTLQPSQQISSCSAATPREPALRAAGLAPPGFVRRADELRLDCRARPPVDSLAATG